MGMGFSETIQVMKAVNTEAAKVAAKIEVGGAANDQLAKIVTPKLPMLMRGYSETVYGKAAIANLFSAAIINYFPENEKACLLAEAMTYAAMHDMMSEFNLREMVDEFVNNFDVSSLTETNKENK
jgi:hypothetical protein